MPTPPTRLLAGVSVPDTPLIVDVIDYAQRLSEPYLFNHAMRSWLFAARIGQLKAMDYDLEVVAAKYFYALEDGEVSLEFLFSGTVFYAAEGGWLQTARISWEKEAEFRLPVSLWKEMMEQYFPNSAWIRLHRDAFDQLYDYKVRMGFPTWEAAVEALLRASEQEVER